MFSEFAGVEVCHGSAMDQGNNPAPKRLYWGNIEVTGYGKRKWKLLYPNFHEKSLACCITVLHLRLWLKGSQCLSEAATLAKCLCHVHQQAIIRT